MNLNANLIEHDNNGHFDISEDHILRIMLQEFQLILISADGNFGVIKIPQDYFPLIEEQINKDKDQYDENEFNRTISNLNVIKKTFDETGKDELVYYLDNQT